MAIDTARNAERGAVARYQAVLRQEEVVRHALAEVGNDADDAEEHCSDPVGVEQLCAFGAPLGNEPRVSEGLQQQRRHQAKVQRHRKRFVLSAMLERQ
eukprot:2799741-Prymnesium_polylepis.1